MGIITTKIGPVIYMVEVCGRDMKRHIYQLRGALSSTTATLLLDSRVVPEVAVPIDEQGGLGQGENISSDFSTSASDNNFVTLT